VHQICREDELGNMDNLLIKLSYVLNGHNAGERIAEPARAHGRGRKRGHGRGRGRGRWALRTSSWRAVVLGVGVQHSGGVLGARRMRRALLTRATPEGPDGGTPENPWQG